MNKCENCGHDHDGSYGTGRFCDSKCARGFATKSKRKEINEKVSKSLTGREGWVPKDKIRGFTKKEQQKGSEATKQKHLIEGLELFELGELKNPRRIRNILISKYGNKCFVCPVKDNWNDKPIVMEVDHIDGNPQNNMPDNLRLICPNCHSQTPTFRGRNIGTGNRSYMKKYYGKYR